MKDSISRICKCGSCGVCQLWARRDSERIRRKRTQRQPKLKGPKRWEIEMDWRAVELDRGFPIADTRAAVIPYEQSRRASPRMIIERR